MNFIKRISISLFAVLFLLSTGCQKDAKVPADALAHVPATASTVTAINLKKLMQKADFESVKKMAFYQDMMAGANNKSPEIGRILMDPETSGIDFEQKAYLATDVNKDNPEEMTTFLFFTLKNAGDFTNLFKGHSGEITEKNGIKMLGNSTNSMLGWNDRLAVFAFSTQPATEFSDQVVQLFKAGPANGAAALPGLLKALDGDHDFANWTTTDQLAENPAAGMALNLIAINPDALKGNHIHSYGDFEKGRIVGRSDFFISKDLGEQFIGRFFKDEVDTDFSSILPGEGLTAAVACAMDLRGLDKFLSERPQSKEYADFVLNDMGMKRKDLLEVFGGDMLFATYGGEKGIEDTKLLVAAQMKSKKKAQEFLDQAEKQGKLKKIEAGYYKIVSIGTEDFSITRSRGMGRILLRDEQLVFSTNVDLIEKIKSGKFEKADKLAGQIKGQQTFSAWMDFETMTSMLGGMKGKWFKDMQFKVNSKGADFIMETNDPGTNSLNSIFQMMNEAYMQRKMDGSQKTM